MKKRNGESSDNCITNSCNQIPVSNSSSLTIGQQFAKLCEKVIEPCSESSLLSQNVGFDQVHETTPVDETRYSNPEVHFEGPSDEPIVIKQFVSQNGELHISDPRGDTYRLVIGQVSPDLTGTSTENDKTKGVGQNKGS